MLSDHAQERMRPLKRPFRAEDPEFIRSFAMRAQWHLRREHGDSVSLTIGIVAALPLGALLQPAGSSGGAQGVRRRGRTDLAGPAASTIRLVARRDGHQPIETDR